MRKLLWVIGAAVCVLAAPAFATTAALQAQGQIAGIVGSPIPSQKIGAFLVAQAGNSARQVVVNGNADGNGNGNCGNGNSNTPSKPNCKPK
jgi:hypothetical protein